jgi:amino acid transporter
MKNPLDSIPGTIICGLILTAVLYYVVLLAR